MIATFIRNGFLAALVVAAASVAASAQTNDETPKGEVFAGYSFLSVDTAGFRDRGDVHGFNVTGAGHFNEWFSLAGEVSGHYEGGDALHYVTGGPRVTYRNDSRVEPYAHVLAGAAFANSNANFALVAGGGVDVKVSDKVAIRAVQVDYAPIFFDNFTLHNVKVSTGVVFRF
jgi:opacity protein-like surface antigen